MYGKCNSMSTLNSRGRIADDASRQASRPHSHVAIPRSIAPINAVYSRNPIHTADRKSAKCNHQTHISHFSSLTSPLPSSDHNFTSPRIPSHMPPPFPKKRRLKSRSRNNKTYHFALFIPRIHMMRHGQYARNRRRSNREHGIAMIEHVDKCDAPRRICG